MTQRYTYRTARQGLKILLFVTAGSMLFIAACSAWLSFSSARQVNDHTAYLYAVVAICSAAAAGAAFICAIWSVLSMLFESIEVSNDTLRWKKPLSRGESIDLTGLEAKALRAPDHLRPGVFVFGERRLKWSTQISDGNSLYQNLAGTQTWRTPPLQNGC